VSGWRRLANRLVPALAIVWVMFLGLGTLQPCCEAIADSFVSPARAPFGEASHHGARGDIHDHRASGEGPVHTHCGETLLRHFQLKAVATPEPGQGWDRHPPSLFPVHRLRPVGPPARGATAGPAVGQERPPPLPVYLATLRLRI